MANSIIIQQVKLLATRAGEEAADLRALIGTTATNAATALTNATTDITTAYTNAVATAKSEAKSEAATDYNAKIGTLTTLTTDAKGSLVLAVNEVKGLVATAQQAADDAASAVVALIDDEALTTVTDKTYSAKKVSEVATAAATAAVNALVDGAPDALNTLNEIAASIGDQADYAAGITTALGQKMAKDQNLNDVADKALARTNLAVYSTSQVYAKTETYSKEEVDALFEGIEDLDLVGDFDAAANPAG